MSYRVTFPFVYIIWNGQIRVTNLSIITNIVSISLCSKSSLLGSLAAHDVLKFLNSQG